MNGELPAPDRADASMAGAWLLVAPEALPEELRTRAVPLALVVLRRGESVATAPDRGAPMLLDEQELALARLVARGLKYAEIAAQLHVSLRTVDRRLARLRERFGVRTVSQLVAELGRRGLA